MVWAHGLGTNCKEIVFIQKTTKISLKVVFRTFCPTHVPKILFVPTSSVFFSFWYIDCSNSTLHLNIINWYFILNMTYFKQNFKKWNFEWQLHPEEFPRVRWNYTFSNQNCLNIYLKLVLALPKLTQVTILRKNCWKIAKIGVFQQLCLNYVPKLLFCAHRWNQLTTAVILMYLLSR